MTLAAGLVFQRRRVITLNDSSLVDTSRWPAQQDGIAVLKNSAVTGNWSELFVQRMAAYRTERWNPHPSQLRRNGESGRTVGGGIFNDAGSTATVIDSIVSPNVLATTAPAVA